MVFLIVTLLIALSSEAFWSALQSYFGLRSVPVEWFGALFTIVATTSAISAFVYRYIEHRLSWQTLSVIIILFNIAGLCLAQWGVPYMPVAVSAIIGLGFGLIWPTSMSFTRQYVASQYRATVGSLRGVIYNVGFAVATVMIGVYADTFGVAQTLRMLGLQSVVTLCITITLFVVISKRIKPQV